MTEDTERNWFILSHGSSSREDLGTEEIKIWRTDISAIGPFTKEEAEDLALASKGIEGTILVQSDRVLGSGVILEHLIKNALQESDYKQRMLEIAEETQGLDLDKVEDLLGKEIEEKKRG